MSRNITRFFSKLSLSFRDSAKFSLDVEYLTSDTITSSTFHKPNKLPFSNELSFTSFSLLGVKQYITVITMEWCFCSVLNLTLIDIMLPRRRIVLWRITCSGLILWWGSRDRVHVGSAPLDQSNSSQKHCVEHFFIRYDKLLIILIN